jgi:hypothetical protein
MEEEPAMAVKKLPHTFNVGDIVNIRNSAIKRGKIVEARGPLAPGGKQVYRVIVRRKPKPVYIELSEDQLTLVPAGTD